MSFKTPPLPRHPALQPLSRAHYQVLVHARRLTKAADANAVDRRAAVAEFLDAWNDQIAVHLLDEEQMLKPLASEADAVRLMDEHDRLRAMADEARDRRRHVDPGAGWVRQLGTALHDHARWEERHLFPSLQQSAGDSLDALLPQSEQIETSRRRGR